MTLLALALLLASPSPAQPASDPFLPLHPIMRRAGPVKLSGAPKASGAPQLPRSVAVMMARRANRMHHFLWHAARSGWPWFDEETKAALRKAGWEPPRPTHDRDGRANADAGEDFLYMHRWMIGKVNAELARVGRPDYPKVEGWKVPPPPGDPDYPVPPAWDGPDEMKTDDFYFKAMIPWHQGFIDPAKLKGMSLAELGMRLEFTIHGAMHMRWAADPGDYAPDLDPRDPSRPDPKWDDPKYDFLGDTYSSQVNPHFWKLHGYIDDRIGDWMKANGLAGEVPWKGTWIGPVHDHGAYGLSDDEERAAAAVLRSPVYKRLPPFPVLPELAP